MEDNEFILESARRLERWENTPRRVPDDYADMNRDELIKLAIYARFHSQPLAFLEINPFLCVRTTK